MFTDLNDDSSDLEKRIEMQIGRLSIVLDDKFTLDSSLSTEIKLTFFFFPQKGSWRKTKHFQERNTKTTSVQLKSSEKKNLSFGE